MIEEIDTFDNYSLNSCGPNFWSDIWSMFSNNNLHQRQVNSFTNNKILDMTKLKTFADDELKVAIMTISLFDRVKNTVGKGEMLVTSIFSLPTGFSKVLSLRVVRCRDCVV